MIHDVDKHNDDRGTPMPNTTDVHATTDLLMAKQTISTTYSVNATQTVRSVFKNNLLVWYDGNNNVSSIYGYLPQVSSIPISIIAVPGKDVFTDVLGISRPAGL